MSLPAWDDPEVWAQKLTEAHEEIARLREREARLEAALKAEGKAADANGRDARAAEARVKEADELRDGFRREALAHQERYFRAEARVARLEKALREIQATPRLTDTHYISRRALEDES